MFEFHGFMLDKKINVVFKKVIVVFKKVIVVSVEIPDEVAVTINAELIKN